MNKAVPGWSSGDIYRDITKLTKLVSLVMVCGIINGKEAEMKPKYEEIQEEEYTANLHTNGRNVLYKVVTDRGADVIRCQCGLSFRDPKASEKFKQHNLDGTHTRRMK